LNVSGLAGGEGSFLPFEFRKGESWDRLFHQGVHLLETFARDNRIPQLICYSWISGILEVALVVFVRKHGPEIQYLRAVITEEQRQEFGRLVETTIGQIEAAQFVSHSGIRFPQNGCLSSPHLGLCLNNQPLIDTNLVRKAGASDLDWLDELVD